MSRSLISIAAVGVLFSLAPASAQQNDPAADYPNRAVRVIVTVPAGGGVDSITRIVAEGLQKRFGQPFIVENRGGSAGNIGAEAVFTAEPDGYTLMAAQPAPLTVNQVLYKKLNFDPTKFEPIVVMTSIPNTITARPDFPANTAQEFVAYVRANPGKLNYASQGNGTTSHLTAELFANMTGTKLTHVPYKGTAPAINDLIASHVDVFFVEMAAALKLHEAKKAKILAVTTEKRVPQLPNVPTLEEAGVHGVISGTWNAFAAPPKTPAPIIAKLNAAINEILKAPDVRAHLDKVNMQPVGGSPAEMAQLLKDETQRWGDVVRKANVTIN